MSVNAGLYSSQRATWATPRGVFADLHAEFRFTVDVCALPDSACLPRYWTPRDDALLRTWEGERAYMNPPYGREIPRWVEKAWTESAHALVVGLLPCRTDTAWWHDYVMPAQAIRFLRGRLTFEGAENGAPFPSCVVVWQDAV